MSDIEFIESWEQCGPWPDDDYWSDGEVTESRIVGELRTKVLRRTGCWDPYDPAEVRLVEAYRTGGFCETCLHGENMVQVWLHRPGRSVRAFYDEYEGISSFLRWVGVK